MNNPRYTFKKPERIVSQKAIDQLFSSAGSHRVTAFPVKAVYIIKERAREDAQPLQLLVSVPKRQLKHAVDRNRVKRQLREAYRQQRQQLLAQHLAPHQAVSIAFIWQSPNLLPSAVVTAKVATLLNRIAKTLHAE